MEASVWLPWAPGRLGSSPARLLRWPGPREARPHLSFQQSGGCETGVRPALGHTAQGPATAVSPLGPSRHLPTWVHCTPNVCTPTVCNPCGPGMGQATCGPGNKCPLLEEPPGAEDKITLPAGVPEGSPTHFPKQRRKAACPGSHSTLPDRKALELPTKYAVCTLSTLPDRKALELPASMLSPPLESQVQV